MTGLAITAIRRATLDERISGNLREQNLAFQAAELALRYCQNDLEKTHSIAYRDQGNENMPTEWDTMDWATEKAVTTLPAGTVANVAAQPQCLIEKWNFQNKAPINSTSAANRLPVYLITARGVGANSNAVVWLQTTYREGN